MADHNATYSYVERDTSSGGSVFLAFVLGAVVLALGAVVWILYGDQGAPTPATNTTSIQIETPSGDAGATMTETAPADTAQ